MRLFTTGEVASLLRGVSGRQIDYALRQGHAGNVLYAGGRRLLSAANLRTLARHFGKPIPREALADLDPADLEQMRGGRSHGN